MATQLRVVLLALAALSLTGCAVGSRLGWNVDRVEPTATDRAACEAAVKTLEGKADHAIALRACLDSKTHR